MQKDSCYFSSPTKTLVERHVLLSETTLQGENSQSMSAAERARVRAPLHTGGKRLELP